MLVRQILRLHAIAAIALIFGFSVVAAAPEAMALTGYAYAGLDGTTTGVYGIDGYIRPSTTTTVASPLHRAEWVNLCRASCDQWVQIGTYQGYLPNSSSPSASHVYVENNWTGCSYSQSDKGGLVNPNQAYYISYTGTSLGNACGTSRGYEFAMRKGSYSNSPIAYGYMGGTSGQAIAQEELYSNGPSVPHNTTYFGVNDSLIPTSSNGLHLQSSFGGTWDLWSSSNLGGTRSYNPPYLTVLQNYWSFKTSPTP